MKVIITGYGRMGKLIEERLEAAGHQVAARIDTKALANSDDRVTAAEDLASMEQIADIIMDFSNPSFTAQVVEYAGRTKTPLLSGTTNLTAEQFEAFDGLAAEIPVLWASNYSLGVNLFKHILPEITEILKGWDIEITETHHNRKVDAPSGTAKTLADAIDPEGKRERVYGREGNCGARTSEEIGMHALRGGTVAGEHTVSYFGEDEIFEITHRAGSRQIFVDGAIKVAETLVKKNPGRYTVDDILFG